MTSAVDPNIITAAPVDKAAVKGQLQIIKDEITALQALSGPTDPYLCAFDIWAETTPGDTPIVPIEWSPWSQVVAPPNSQHVSGVLHAVGMGYAATAGILKLRAVLLFDNTIVNGITGRYPLALNVKQSCMIPYAFQWTLPSPTAVATVQMLISTEDISGADVRLMNAQFTAHFTR